MSAFSDFIRNASVKEKEAVYRKVMEKATKKQKKLLKEHIEKSTKLVTNTKPAIGKCSWCSADKEPHSAACPLGERYKQVQELGGIPDPNLGETPLCLECGKEVEPYSMTCDECHKKILASLKAKGP